MSRISRLPRNAAQFLIIALIVAHSVAFGSESADPPKAPIPPPSAARLTPAVAAVKKALPWVVNIGTTEQIVQIDDPFDLFFNQFFNYRGELRTMTQYSPLGSGVIVDASGLVLTNSHVVQRANQIEVRLWNGHSYPARIAGYDIPNDLCLLQLEGDFAGEALAAAEFAHADDLLLGESVITIGNPFGLEHSVSQGVLSAFNRSFEEDGITFADIIQTDAAINPGNSGGPLINLDGQLIGINLAIRADAQGIGFAIPLARIERFLAYWLRPEHFTRGYIGMPLEEAPLTVEGGVQLPKLDDDAPLAKAGLKEGDVIAAINGAPVTRQFDFSRAIFHAKPDDELLFTDSQGSEHRVRVGKMPGKLLITSRLGLKLEELTKKARKAMDLPDNWYGLVISEVDADPFYAMQDAGWRRILKRGDIVVQINRQDVKSLEEASKILEEFPQGKKLTLGILSTGLNNRNYLPVEIQVIPMN